MKTADLNEPGWAVEMTDGGGYSIAKSDPMTLGEAVAISKAFHPASNGTVSILPPDEVEDETETELASEGGAA